MNGDGGQTRDYVYVGDVVRANLAALEYTGPEETFNIGTGIETDVATLYARLAEAALSPEFPPYQIRERIGAELAETRLALAEAERTTRLIDSLLVLARADAGEGGLQRAGRRGQHGGAAARGRPQRR